MFSLMRLRPLILLSMLILTGLFTACRDDDEGVACNDSFAENYNPGSVNNLDCSYPNSFKSIETIAELPATLQEISGLARYGELLIGHNDRGNPARLHAFSPEDGSVQHSFNVTNVPNIDWEDLAQNEDYLFVGDFGNNEGDRQDLAIHLIPWSSIDPAQSLALEVDTSIFFRYPEQTRFDVERHNFDCEAMIYWQGMLYLFTKHRADDRSNLYRVPMVPGVVHDAQLLGGFNAGGRITGADISADGGIVALVGYKRSGNCFVWKLTEFQEGSFLSGRKEQYTFGPYSVFGQMESIIFASDTELYIGSEEDSNFNLPPRLYRVSDF